MTVERLDADLLRGRQHWRLKLSGNSFFRGTELLAARGALTQEQMEKIYQEGKLDIDRVAVESGVYDDLIRAHLVRAGRTS